MGTGATSVEPSFAQVAAGDDKQKQPAERKNSPI
jgi:hypothetical protein